MRSTYWLWSALALLVLSSGCGKASSQEEGLSPKELGLSKTNLDETPVPDAVVPNTTAPGEKPVMPRIYPGSPPLVPHGIADFLPITQQQNLCIDCHQVKEKVAGEPTPIPRSHYIDLRHAPDAVQDHVVGARFRCVACHVPQTVAPPLIMNDFDKED
jgi:cytochrome c-type protein NapB